jgi:hypothetical protein
MDHQKSAPEASRGIREYALFTTLLTLAIFAGLAYLRFVAG